VAPLTVVAGAVHVDTTHLSCEQVVERLEQQVRAVLAGRGALR
jgi:cytidylate kinase